MLRGFLVFLALASSMHGCDPVPVFPAGTVMGFRPIYEGSEEATIKVVAPIPIKDRGKIYVYGNYLLINERFKGVHIIDNTIPALPRNIGFIQIMGNEDIAIKDNLLFADYLGKMVSIDFSDPSNVQLKSKLSLDPLELYGNIPPYDGFYFECTDPTKGKVIGWVEAILIDPKCGTPFAGK